MKRLLLIVLIGFSVQAFADDTPAPSTPSTDSAPSPDAPPPSAS